MDTSCSLGTLTVHTVPGVHCFGDAVRVLPVTGPPGPAGLPVLLGATCRALPEGKWFGGRTPDMSGLWVTLIFQKWKEIGDEF